MNPHSSLSLEDLHRRLLKVEKQNRRFKQLGVAVLILPALLLVMGQAPSKKTVEANEFALKDDGGHVLARLSIKALPGVARGTIQAPVMDFLDEDGNHALSILGGIGGLGGSLFIYSQGKATLVMDSAELRLGGITSTSGKQTTLIESGSLSLQDDERFRTSVGTTDLITPRTGETHKTSAASLTLLDKDKNVIWKAP
jgi:hypothetical protein